MSQHEAAHTEKPPRAHTLDKERAKSKNTVQPLVPLKGWAAAKDAVISFTCKLPSEDFKILRNHFGRQHVGTFDL